MTDRYTGATPRFYGSDQPFPGWDRHYKTVEGHPCVHFLAGEGVVPEGATAHMDSYHDALSPVSRVEFPAGTRLRLVRRGDPRTTCVVEVA